MSNTVERWAVWIDGRVAWLIVTADGKIRLDNAEWALRQVSLGREIT